MRWFIDFFGAIVDTMDQHEGMVAMIGIAVTVIIFIREISNNYFTMERDNFNDIFKEPVMRELPEKLSSVEQAREKEWTAKFEELMGILNQMLIDSKYYKYSIPFFYRCLCIRVDEIADLGRHDNWRLYRSAESQNRLIQKKCRLMIRNINNASKGRVLAIKCFQNRLYQQLRQTVIKQWIDRPADRITEKYIEDELSKFEVLAHDKIVLSGDLKRLEESRLVVKAHNNIHIVGVHVVETGKMFFGYKWNIKWGKNLGITTIKAKRDQMVKVIHRHSAVELLWDDTNIHKVVLQWYEGSDREHIHFKEFNIRKI